MTSSEAEDLETFLADAPAPNERRARRLPLAGYLAIAMAVIGCAGVAVVGWASTRSTTKAIASSSNDFIKASDEANEDLEAAEKELKLALTDLNKARREEKERSTIQDASSASTAKDAAEAIESIIGDEEKWPLDRESLAAIRTYDGTTDKADWEYLKTDCMTERQDMAAERFKAAKCKHVLEVGGYLKPLPRSSKFFGGGEYTELYVNVDPSTLKTTVEEKDGEAGKYWEINLPMLLSEWTGVTGEGGDLFEQVPEFDCVIMIGAWAPELNSEAKRAAWQRVTENARVVVMESPKSANYQGICMGEPALYSEGFCEEKTKMLDCSTDSESASLTDDLDHVRRWEKIYALPAENEECGTPTYEGECSSVDIDGWYG